MFLTRSYVRRNGFHKKRKAQKSNFKGISPPSKQCKRLVKLQFWLWRKRHENCILGMFRAKRQAHKNSSFTFKTKKNNRLTKTLGSSAVLTPPQSCVDVANGVRQKKEVCQIKNSVLKPGDLSAYLTALPAESTTFNKGADTDLITNSECLHKVEGDQKVTIDEVLAKDKNAGPITSTKLTISPHLNISSKKLVKAVQDYLDESHRKYGSFIPLEMGDVLNHLKNKFDKDTEDMNKIILEVTKELMEKQEKPTPFFQVVYKKHTLMLEDLSTLADENWLNDQVINMYGELIMDSAHCKVHFLNSFFHRQLMTKGYEGVKRWTKQVDLFSKCLLLVPVHLEVHWCLVTADLVKKKICLYDSHGNGLQKVARNILKYLLNEAKEKKQSAFESGWTVSSNEEVPQQTNENDCGVFVLEYSRCLALSEPLQFSQEDIPKIRRRVYKELCECKLHEKVFNLSTF